MKVQIVPRTERKQAVPSQGYDIIFQTMQGDADDYHTFTIPCGMDEAELRKFVIAAEVMKNTYPCGRGGYDDYEGEIWDLFSGHVDWYYDEMGITDSMDGYKVIYHDGLGTIIPCGIVLDEHDNEEIDKIPPQDGGRPLISGYQMAKRMLKNCETALKSESPKEFKQSWIDAKPKYEAELEEYKKALEERGIAIPTEE